MERISLGSKSNSSSLTTNHLPNRNPGYKTIEGCLEEALFEAKLISEDNFGNHSKINWGRASRTDKGVHAAMNAFCCKVQILKEHLHDFVTEEDIA